jgi:hypothetical protein
MTKKLDYMNVPIDLCKYSLENRITNQTMLYLYLKSKSDGYLKTNDERIMQALKDLGMCHKTLRKHLNWLITEGWLIMNINNSGIRVISYKLLSQKLNFKYCRGSILYKSNIHEFKYFAISSVIQFQIRGLRWRNRQAGLLKRNPELGEVPPYPLLPHTYLAKVLNMPKSTAARYKKMAGKKKYLTTRKKFLDLEIPVNYLSELKKYGNYNPDRLRNRRSNIYYQLPDKIETNILIRKKWNLKKTKNKNSVKEKNGT